MEKPEWNSLHEPPPQVRRDPEKLRLWREYWKQVEYDISLEEQEEKRKRQYDPRSRRGRRYDRNPDGL